MADQNQDDILNLEDLIEEVDGGAEPTTRKATSTAESAPTEGEQKILTAAAEADSSPDKATGTADSTAGAPRGALAKLGQRLAPLSQKINQVATHPGIQRLLTTVSGVTSVLARVTKLIPVQKLAKVAKVPAHAARTLRRGLEKSLAYLLWFFRAPWLIRFQILLMAMLMGALIFVTNLFLKGEFLTEPEPYAIGTLEQKADAVFQIAPDEYYESFTSPLRQPDYYILFKKVIVQLKAYPDQRHPMAAVRLYAEASNQEAAVELRDREDEFLDLIQRTLETYPIEELSTAQGKIDLKDHLRVKMNQALSRGRVHALYFHEILLKR